MNDTDQTVSTTDLYRSQEIRVSATVAGASALLKPYSRGKFYLPDRIVVTYSRDGDGEWRSSARLSGFVLKKDGTPSLLRARGERAETVDWVTSFVADHHPSAVTP